MKKIIGLGNALTDILLQIENDSILNSLNIQKGSMQLVNQEKSEEISNLMSQITPSMVTGGSASNTINGLTRLGASAAFIGKVGNDSVGDFYSNNTLENKVTPLLLKSETPSGRCIVLISPDGERTMCTYLGAAAELTADDITPDFFEGYDIFHIEGYLVQNHELIRKAVKLADEAGLLVSIDMASFNIVDENLEFLKEIVKKHVNIVFANEKEAFAFTGKEPNDALIHISEQTDIAVVKIGKEGSFVKRKDEMHLISPYNADAKCIDSTGAGDLYAAGFLYGLSKDYPLDVCGKIGSLVSSRVIEVVGAKMENHIWDSLIENITEIVASVELKVKSS